MTAARHHRRGAIWIGTPYRHQASLKGVGCDCLGLLRGVWREVDGRRAGIAAALFAGLGGGRRRDAARRGAPPSRRDRPSTPSRAGDVLLFRWREHCRRSTAPSRRRSTPMVHAHDGACVAEVAFRPWWRRHLAYAFRFPESDLERSSWPRSFCKPSARSSAAWSPGRSGAMAGRALGGLAGAAIDNALFGRLGRQGRRRAAPQGDRRPDLDRGRADPARLWPRAHRRAADLGDAILEEVANTKVERSGSQGGKGIGGGGPKTTTTTYSYFANLAVGLCEGPDRASSVASGRMAARSTSATVAMRVHRGDETQAADPLIVAKEGAAYAPAYRGLAYVVFERLPLAEFGNRVPQFSFEVVRPVDGLNRMVRAVCLIPGATRVRLRHVCRSRKRSASARRGPRTGISCRTRADVHASLDALRGALPEPRSACRSW